MKLALVHDHLIQMGGAEKVLQSLCELWPQAPIYTLLFDAKKIGQYFDKSRITTSYLQEIPGALRYYKWLLPFMPQATENHNLSGYDIIVSSSSAFSKGVIIQPHSLHICYCHTPTRYLWSDTHSYVRELRYGWIIKKILPSILTRLRMWDYVAAQRVDCFVANSKNVQNRIKKYYKQDSTIIHPPVETEKYYSSDTIERYYLTGGRLVAYKKFDITIKAFNRLGIQLKIFGEGPELFRLRQYAKKNIEFLGYINQGELATIYSKCIAFIHPQEEDFGITAIEAMASGRPVIAYKAGGALETIEDGTTGVFIDEQSWEALADMVVRFKPENFNPHEIKQHADKYSVKQFKSKILNLVESQWGKRTRIL